jgi:hypothetical protein
LIVLGLATKVFTWKIATLEGRAWYKKQ